MSHERDARDSRDLLRGIACVLLAVQLAGCATVDHVVATPRHGQADTTIARDRTACAAHARAAAATGVGQLLAGKIAGTIAG